MRTSSLRTSRRDTTIIPVVEEIVVVERHNVDGPADRNPFDLDPNVGQLLVNQLLMRPCNQSDLDVGLFNFTPGNRDLFDIKRNAHIFWSLLLIGHASPLYSRQQS